MTELLFLLLFSVLEKVNLGLLALFCCCCCCSFSMAQWHRICLLVQETQVRSLDREDALEKEMATHSSIFAWRIPGAAEPCGLPSMGSHRVRHDGSNLAAAAASIFAWEINGQRGRGYSQ